MLAFVSHDAGGAEILSSYARVVEEEKIFVLDGPAKAIFERKLGSINHTSSTEALQRARHVVLGTSWQSDLEWQMLRNAREQQKATSVFLDHWVNYGEGFIRNGIRILPDEIIVGDEDALRIAKATFPDTTINLFPNPYFAEIRETMKNLINAPPSHNGGDRILFVCENISDHAKIFGAAQNPFGYDEFDAIRYFFDHLAKVAGNVSEIIFRPHPSDPQGKYARILGEYRGKPVRISNERTLPEQIAECDIVVGCESMAMVIGLLAGKKVYSVIPPKGRKISLPQNEIIRLNEQIPAA